MYKKARANFKYALHYCKCQEAVTLSNKMAAEMSAQDYDSLWDTVRKHNQSTYSLCDTVDGAVGAQNIADMWGQHRKTLLNSSSESLYKEAVINNCRSIVFL